MSISPIIRRSSSNKYLHIFLEKAFVPNLFKWSQVGSIWVFGGIVSLCAMTGICLSPQIFTRQLLTSLPLFFWLSFHSMIKEIVMVFVFILSETARSITDPAIWLEVFSEFKSLASTWRIILSGFTYSHLLLLASLVCACIALSLN